MEKEKLHNIYRWTIGSLVIIVLLFGWKYPYLGYIVPLTMVMAITMGFLKGGRWFCGNMCPRGCFWDKNFSLIASKKPVPIKLKKSKFKLLLLGMMAFFVIYLFSDITNLRHVGFVFWLLCAVTTGIGIVGGIIYNKRFWCTFCPIGKVLSFMVKDKDFLKIDKDKCISCHLCDKNCPMDIKPESYKEKGKISNRNCLFCKQCLKKCPKKAISE